MGKNLRGKEIGKGITQKKDGTYVSRFVNKRGKRVEKCFKTLPEARNWLDDARYQDSHSDAVLLPDTTVDEWWQTNVNEVGVVFDNINIESEENITMSEVYGKKYIYTASLGDFNYKIMQAACIKGSSVYLFTYTAIPENYDLHTEDVAAMLEHFIIK